MRLQPSELKALTVQEPKDLESVKRIILSNKEIVANLPDTYALDPLSKRIRTYCPKREKRNTNTSAKKRQECYICEGKTTPVIFTESMPNFIDKAFVNFNLYPGFSPVPMQNISTGERDIYGYQFVVWTSTEHKPAYELSETELIATLNLFKKLESLVGPEENLLVTKNTGTMCGNSISHEHYQALISNIIPQRIIQDKEYLRDAGTSLAKHTFNSDKSRKIGHFDSMVALVPYFQRRGLEAIITPKNSSERYFNDLSNDSMNDLARAITAINKKLFTIMPSIKKEPSFNIIFHTGDIGQMYVEFLPFMQADAGLEKAGIDVCQINANQSHEFYCKDGPLGVESNGCIEFCNMCGSRNLQVSNIKDIAFSFHYDHDIADFNCRECNHSWHGDYGRPGLA